MKKKNKRVVMDPSFVAHFTDGIIRYVNLENVHLDLENTELKKKLASSHRRIDALRREKEIIHSKWKTCQKDILSLEKYIKKQTKNKKTSNKGKNSTFFKKARPYSPKPANYYGRGPGGFPI